MRFKNSDGIQLSYADEGAGEPIVLIHGFPLSRATWDEQAAMLSGGARVIRPDLRGLGDSDVPLGPYEMATLARDVAELLDHLGVARATVVGHSLGGYVALAFYRHFRERTRGLGLVCSRVQADPPEVARARYELADRIEREGMAPFIEAVIPVFFAERIYEDRPDIVRRAREIVLARDPRGAAAMYRGMATRPSCEDLLPGLTIPFLTVIGADDRLIAPQLQRYAAEAVPGTIVVELAGCGHFPLYERPVETARALESLLNRN